MILETIKRLAPRRTIVVACDLTNADEGVLSGTAYRVQKQLAKRPAAHEITLMIAGRRGRKNRQADNGRS